jgi:methionyl-tRNA formyltransferase
MKIIFAGTPPFAAAALETLHQTGFEIALVLTQPDRPAGRGMQLQPSAVKHYALQHNLPLFQPNSLRLNGKYYQEAEQAHTLLRATEHNLMVVAAYGLILPQSILDIPPLGCLNIHASLLPRWRGAAPIHRAIEAGDSETGITIMQMEAGLDTGPMLAMQRLPILPDDTSTSLHDKLAKMGADLIVQTLFKLAHQQLEAVPQPEDGVTYANKILKDEAALDFTLPALTLDRKIRAFNPFPGALTHFNGVPIKIWRAELIPTTSGLPPGSLVAANAHDGVIVVCGDGLLRLHELQKPGGKHLPAIEFLKGFPMEGGQFHVAK